MPAPTIEPVEQRILQNVLTTLADISTTSTNGDFFTDVEAVHLMDQAPDAVGQTLDLPCVVVVHKGLEAAWGEATGLVMKRQALDIYCIHNRTDTWLRDILRFAHDVERALAIDWKRGEQDGQPNAFDTLFLASDVGNLVEGNRIAMARVSVAVDFRSETLNPTLSG